MLYRIELLWVLIGKFGFQLDGWFYDCEKKVHRFDYELYNTFKNH